MAPKPLTPAGMLLSVVEQLASSTDTPEVIETIRTTARRLIGADGISIVLRDGEVCHYIEEDAIAPLWKGQRFPLTSCISGWAMLHKETAVVPDIFKDDRIPHDLYAGTFVRSLIMAPVRTNEPIGAIGAYWAETYQPLPEEVDTLETVARAAATALEHVRLIAAPSRALSDAELARDELRHRVKNAFVATQALASLTLPNDQARALSTRITALARAHELIDRKLAHEASIALDELLNAELTPYETEGAGRLHIKGKPVHLQSVQAIALGLAINELATNSLKYGALSTPKGTVDVQWNVQDNHLSLTWTESDGPEVRANSLESFGSRLLRRLIEGQLAGTIQRRLERSGVICILEIPLIPVAGTTQDDRTGVALT